MENDKEKSENLISFKIMNGLEKLNAQMKICVDLSKNLFCFCCKNHVSVQQELRLGLIKLKALWTQRIDAERWRFDG